MRIILTLLLLAFLGGCATGPHRHDATPCTIGAPVADGDTLTWEHDDGPCRHAWAVRYAGDSGTHGQPGGGRHDINYVEIDEQGVLHNRQAAEDALAFAQKPGEGGRQVYMVVFIHGWHHNAEPDDANVQAFHSALASVSAWNPDKEVRGIYIGWRGKAWRWPAVRYLTFWDRKSTSEEVGRGGLLEFLLRLERAVKNGALAPASSCDGSTDEATKAKQRDNRLVLVGHSFGASVAFNALAHVFLERFLDGVYAPPCTQGPRFRGYGDLVMLINPAIEAMRYMPLQSALEYYTSPEAPLRADFSQETVPRLVVLSSNGDWATRYAFPFARFVSTLTESHAQVSPLHSPDRGGAYSEHEMDGATLGNFKAFHTHGALRFDTAAKADATVPPDADRTGLHRCSPVSAPEVRKLLSAADAGADGRSFPDSRLRLDARAGSAYRPYVLAAADTAVIADHTAIGEPHLVCWINQLADVR